MENEYIDPKRYIKRDTTKSSNEPELYDLTDEFIEVFEKLSNKPGFGGIFWIIGTFGAGKSALLCILCNLFLKYGYEKRNIALYQAPKKLLETIQKAVPREFQHKFRIVERLSEVKPFDILCIDEGYLSADAKKSLEKDSVNFIASLTTLRHSSVFSILNSPDDGILRGYRLKAQIRMYKLLPDGYIDEVNDRFAKKYGDIITKLREDQTIFQVTHIDFLKKGIRRGALILPLKEYCPWYNEQISRNFEGEDFDAYMRKLKKKKHRMEAVIQLLIDKFGNDLNRKRAEGFLFDKHIGIFREFESDMGNIVKVALFRMYETKQAKIIIKNEIDTKEKIEEFTDFEKQMFDIFKFDTFKCSEEEIFTLIKKNAKWHDIERNLTIYQEKKRGKYLQEIGDNFGINFSTVSGVVTKVQGAINRWKGKLFEDFVENKLKKSGLFKDVIKEAGKGEADILAYTKDGKELYIYSIKNLKIDRKPFWLITKEELLPELKDSKLTSLDYDTHLILLVYDNHHKKVFQTEIDYNHVENIDLTTL